MKCLRCGYCCTTLLVVIVVDPNKGVKKDNLRGINLLNERCPHLRGDKPGEYCCTVHDRQWFKKTPCAEYQSHWPDKVCKMGEFTLLAREKELENDHPKR